MAVTKVLKLTFKNGENKNSTITIRHPKEGLAEDTVKAAMQTVVDAAIFSKDEVNPYVEVVGAKYYTTESDDIFKSETK